MTKLKVLMPKSLSAENGAKELLSGEFYQTIESECPACYGLGTVCNFDECDKCKGGGTVLTKITIDWTTIKDIYSKAVKHLAE